MMTRRAHDAPTYNPATDRKPSPWNSLDTGMQRIVAVAAALVVLLSLVGWVGRTLSFDARLSALESRSAATERKVDATLAVTCIIARKTDPTVEPSECKP